jgi:hypothetical protein
MKILPAILVLVLFGCATPKTDPHSARVANVSQPAPMILPAVPKAPRDDRLAPIFDQLPTARRYEILEESQNTGGYWIAFIFAIVITVLTVVVMIASLFSRKRTGPTSLGVKQ